MAQTTTAMAFKDAYISWSTAGGSTTFIGNDASGETNSLTLSGFERNHGTAFTADGDTPVIKAGKRNEGTISINALYESGVAGFVSKAQTAYEAGSAMYIRWAPAGATAANIGYTSSVGIVKNFTYPTGEVGGGEPIAISIDVVCATITQAALT